MVFKINWCHILFITSLFFIRAPLLSWKPQADQPLVEFIQQTYATTEKNTYKELAKWRGQLPQNKTSFIFEHIKPDVLPLPEECDVYFTCVFFHQLIKNDLLNPILEKDFIKAIEARIIGILIRNQPNKEKKLISFLNELLSIQRLYRRGSPTWQRYNSSLIALKTILFTYDRTLYSMIIKALKGW